MMTLVHATPIRMLPPSFRMIKWVVLCAALNACGGGFGTESGRSNSKQSFGDAASMKLRGDGNYDVVCKSGKLEIDTAQQIQSGQICLCAPTTCAGQGASCGTLSDGCGSALNCGVCSGTDTCGGTGSVNVCGTPSEPWRAGLPVGNLSLVYTATSSPSDLCDNSFCQDDNGDGDCDGWTSRSFSSHIVYKLLGQNPGVLQLFWQSGDANPDPSSAPISIASDGTFAYYYWYGGQGTAKGSISGLTLAVNYSGYSNATNYQSCYLKGAAQQ